MACTLDTQLKGVTSRVEQQAQGLREETLHLCKELQATQQNFETRLTAVVARTRRTGKRNVGTNAAQVVPSKFDGTTSWSTFHRQLVAAADNGWTPHVPLGERLP
jgi:hypothetical protein